MSDIRAEEDSANSPTNERVFRTVVFDFRGRCFVMKKEVCIYSTAMIALILAIAQAGSAMTLDEYLQAVQKKNHTLQSLDVSKEAATSRAQQGDLELSPILSAGGSYLDDKSLTSLGTAVLTHNQVRQYNL